MSEGNPNDSTQDDEQHGLPRVVSDLGQFAIVPLWLARQASGPAVRLFAILHAEWADRDTGRLWPTHRTIANAAGIHPGSVRRLLDELRDLGAVSWHPRYDAAGDLTSNVYTLHHARGGTRNSARTGPRISARENQNQLEPESTHTRDAHECAPVNLFDPPRSVRPEGARARRKVDDEFNDFWEHWPRKVGRAAAVKAFAAAVRRDGLPAVESGWNRWLTWWDDQATERRFIPHASTWLNQARYLEDPQ